MKDLILMLLFVAMVFALFMFIPMQASADFDELTIQINVYQGDTFIGATNMQAYPGEDLCLTSLNELYGDPQSANVTINGVAGMALTWSFPDYLTYVTSSFGWAEIGDEVVINLYYPAVETDPEPEEITYGTLILDLAVNSNDTPTNYSIFLKGTKGVDTIEGTYAFPEDGILTLTNLDVSYAWEYTFNNSTWPVDFDENNTYYNQLSVQTAPEPEPITEGNEHMVYITWEYCQEAGGNMVDGHADNAFVAGTTSFPAVSGAELDLNDLYQNPPGATYAGDNLVQVGNNFYRMSCVYRSGNNVQAGGELENFTMIDDDLDVTFTYIFDHGVETEIEIEKQVYVDHIVEVVKEVPVDKIVEVIKEIPIEVIKEVPVEHIVEVIKEVPVDKIVEVIKEVPVEHIVTVVKEVPVEVIKEVPVDKIVEVVKEVPVEVIKTVEVEKLVTVIKEVPIEIIKEIPVEVIKEVPVEKIVIVTKEVPVEVIKEVPVDKIIEVIKEVPVEKIVEITKEVPVEKVVEVIKEVPVEIIKKVPVEVIKEVPVEKIITVTREVPVVTKETQVVTVTKEVPIVVEKPVVVENHTVTTNTTTNNNSKETTTIKDNTTSDTKPSQNNNLEEIDEGAVPLAELIPSFNEGPENVNTWSLVNLGLLILTFLLWFSYEPLGPGNIITGISMLANIILFMETQDITSKVVWIDKWTWVMAVIYAVGLGIKYYQYRNDSNK